MIVVGFNFSMYKHSYLMRDILNLFEFHNKKMLDKDEIFPFFFGQISMDFNVLIVIDKLKYNFIVNFQCFTMGV
jgi:hypothetical protein